MINFIDVSGPVRVEDGIQSQQAEAGMTISRYGDKCVVATGSQGRAKMTVNGHLMELSGDSYFVVRPQGSRPHRVKTSSSDFKIIVGRIWAWTFKVVGGREGGDFDEKRNAVAGVRG